MTEATEARRPTIVSKPELERSDIRHLASVIRHLNSEFLRKEVIQPQVPLRLPCYDFTPVADPTVVACLLIG